METTGCRWDTNRHQSTRQRWVFVRSFTSSEPWVTLQNDNLDYGVGLLHENALLDFQGWQNRSLPFNNFRSAFYFGIPAYGNVNARAYLLVGGYTTIQADAQWLQNNLPPFGSLDAPAEGVLTKVTRYKSEDGAWTIEASPIFTPSSMNPNKSP